MPENTKTRVLIVDNIPESRENLRRVLQFDNQIDVVGVSNTGRKAIETIREVKPDVVLVDISPPGMEGISTTELIHQNNPAIQVIILSAPGELNVIRQAMLAGASDFLTKPPATEELIAAIQRAGRQAKVEIAKTTMLNPGDYNNGKIPAQSNKKLGKIIVVYSPKGGSGTTTLAVNLGTSLHNEASKVVLVDGDLQFGDLAVFLNMQGRNSILDLASRVDELDPEILEEVLVEHKQTGMRLLTAPSKPEHSEIVSAEQFIKVIEYLRRHFTYVIVDASPMLTDIVIGALDHSDLVMLVTTQDLSAINNTRHFLELAKILKIPRQHILLVVNRFDKRLGILPEKISESFKHDLAAVLPFDERAVTPSINRGIPFMLGDRSRKIVKNVIDLKDAIRKRLRELEQQRENQPVSFPF